MIYDDRNFLVISLLACGSALAYILHRNRKNKFGTFLFAKTYYYLCWFVTIGSFVAVALLIRNWILNLNWYYSPIILAAGFLWGVTIMLLGPLGIIFVGIKSIKEKTSAINTAMRTLIVKGTYCDYAWLGVYYFRTNLDMGNSWNYNQYFL